MIDVWVKAKPQWLLWVATRPGVLTDKELRLFAVFCARQVEHLLVDQRSRDAIAVAEKFANGEATPEELAAARDGAWAATGGAARDAARSASWAAALDAACAAALDAACAAALDAAWAAALDAAWAAASDARAAAWDAASDAARDSQCHWLRKNTTPNFGGKK